MAEQHFGKAYAGNPPANYERFFVPAIGAPLATDLVRGVRYLWWPFIKQRFKYGRIHRDTEAGAGSASF